MKKMEALTLLRGGRQGIEEWNRRKHHEQIPDLSEADLTRANLTGAYLSEAYLVGAKLMGAHLMGAWLEGARLMRAKLMGAKLTEAHLMGANLTRADLCEANLTRANLTGAYLSGANLTASRFIRSNLLDATADNAMVADAQFHELEGLPKPPELLRIDRQGKNVLRGEKARLFFVHPLTVEVVFDRPLTEPALGAYHVFIAECKASGSWPRDVLYLGGHAQDDSTILSYQAPTASVILRSLDLLLRPFRLAQAVDWKALLHSASIREAEKVIETMLASPMYRSHIAERLAQHKGYADATPIAVRVRDRTINLNLDQNAIAHLPGVPQAPIVLQLVEGNTHVTTQHFHGGQFQGCSFGDNNSLNNYFAAVGKAEHLEDDIKEKLKEARAAIEKANLADADKEDVVQQLIALTQELEKPDRDPTRVQRFWKRIKEHAPLVASILSAAASIAKLLGG